VAPRPKNGVRRPRPQVHPCRRDRASPSPTPAPATVPAGAGTPCRAGHRLACGARSSGRRTTPGPPRRSGHRPAGAGSGRGCGLSLQLPSEARRRRAARRWTLLRLPADPEEREKTWKEFLGQLDSLELDAGIRSGEAELAQHAEELGVTAQWRVAAAPFVITGNVDGRGFYLRERHGYYRVTIAPDDDPTADPWELPIERATLDIADGEDDDLTGPDGGYDVAHALTVAVHAVRTFLARRGCEHQQPTDPRQLFCSWCGVRLTEADQWTTT